MEQNSITLRGSLQELPQFSHENHGRRFYRFFLNIPRLSGTVDTIPVIARGDIVEQLDPTAGAMLTVTGQVRSHNYRADGVRHLLIFVFATDVFVEDGEPLNQVSVTGILCREPVYRRTPLGREICDIMLAVPRAFHRADYLPCIAWGRTAQTLSECTVREQIGVYGRLQSRLYTKQTPDGALQKVAYEISALTAQPMGTAE